MKKGETILTITNNGRCHAGTVTNLFFSWLMFELTRGRARPLSGPSGLDVEVERRVG